MKLYLTRTQLRSIKRRVAVRKIYTKGHNLIETKNTGFIVKMLIEKVMKNLCGLLFC